MKLVLLLLASLTLLEVALWLPVWRKLSKTLVLPVGALIATVSAFTLALDVSVWTILLTLIGLYRLLNAIRYRQTRAHADYAWHHSRQSALWLITFHALTAVLVSRDFDYLYDPRYLLVGLIVAQMLVALVLAASFTRQNIKTRAPRLAEHFTDKELPTLTVAIPARNETAELEACLKSLIASDYPKLEILVLDDCSQSKQTSEIIKAYAQSGVRFLAGKAPSEQWLAKNFAYHQLAEQANGELVLFCGVDIRFSPTSLRAIVSALLAKDKQMMSFAPKNDLPMGMMRSMLQPWRYAWEFALPRRLLNRPPVLSSCWIISSDLLAQAGGFGAVSRSIAPESYFARQAISARDSYSFIRSDQNLGLASAKSFEEQYSTAVRTRYPQLRRRLELVAAVSFIQAVAVVAPFTLLAAALWTAEWGYAIPAGITSLLLTYVYVGVVRLTYGRFLLRSIVLLPFAALYDVALMHYSMWRYEFGEVIWKERNVCLPVMQTISRLPVLDERH